jgi:hypothetical protein
MKSESNLLSQVDLMVIASSMQPDFCYMIGIPQMRWLAEGCLRSAFDGPVRRDDILEFVRQTEQNWGVTWHEDQIKGSWTMRKNGEAPEDPMSNMAMAIADKMERWRPTPAISQIPDINSSR